MPISVPVISAGKSSPLGSNMDWDLTSYFSAFGAHDYCEFKIALAGLVEKFENNCLELAPIEPANIHVWRNALLTYGELQGQIGHWNSYLRCLTAADTGNEYYAKEHGACRDVRQLVEKAACLISEQLKNTTEEALSLLLETPQLEDLGFFIKKMQAGAQHKMSLPEEQLATDLFLSGGGAFSTLYTRIAGSLTLKLNNDDGSVSTIPMSQSQGLSNSPDRAVRAKAAAAAAEAWQTVALPLAAAVNSIAHERIVLSGKRGWPDILSMVAFEENIEVEVIISLFDAITYRRDLLDRILKLKAKALEVDALSWHDLHAPFPTHLGAGTDPSILPISWEDATELVGEAFAAYPALQKLFTEAVQKKWFDWSMRKGKAPGSFATYSPLVLGSRFCTSFMGSIDNVRTLAHEVGHGKHHDALFGVNPLNQEYPVILSETASIFAENLLYDHLLAPDPAKTNTDQILSLGQVANTACNIILHIASRFQFEKSLYASRLKGELSAKELCGLSVQAQHQVFGEFLTQGEEGPYAWAASLHFFKYPFYNFQYTMGHLISRRLYQQFKIEGPDFLPKFEFLLRNSGRVSPRELIFGCVGEDIRKQSFWSNALSYLPPYLDQLEQLLLKTPAE